MLTSPQCGALLGKSAKTVIRMAERGDLPFVQKLPGPNGAYLFDPEVVQEKAMQQVLGEIHQRSAGTLFEDDQGPRS